MADIAALFARVDKWLWAVRVFKTRSLAADACRHGHVTIDGQPAKPSRVIKINDVVVVQKDEVIRRLRVLQPLNNRVGAKQVHEFAEEQSPPALPQKPRISPPGAIAVRPRGSGRPTKKERRQIERLFG